MYPSGSDFQNEISQNVANMSLMYTMYLPTFGNYNFSIQAPQEGQTSDQFPTVPYLSPEAVFYQLQSSSPAVAPTNVISGSSAGVQTQASTNIAPDQFGTNRVLSGYQAGGTLL